MKLCRVVGNVVSTIKTESHQNCKLLIVSPINENGETLGDSFIAIDGAQAGIGDTVLIVEEGGSARDVMQKPDGAIDAVIVGIVDSMNVNKQI